MSLQGAGGSGGGAAKNPLIGDVFVVTAQLAAATQFIIEEKYLTAYRVPALLAVGLEGMWGLAISAVALPAMSYVHWPDGTPIDVLSAAIRVCALAFQGLVPNKQASLVLWSPVYGIHC